MAKKVKAFKMPKKGMMSKVKIKKYKVKAPKMAKMFMPKSMKKWKI